VKPSPVVGYVTRKQIPKRLEVFKKGLAELGSIEGKENSRLSIAILSMSWPAGYSRSGSPLVTGRLINSQADLDAREARRPARVRYFQERKLSAGRQSLRWAKTCRNGPVDRQHLGSKSSTRRPEMDSTCGNPDIVRLVAKAQNSRVLEWWWATLLHVFV
jgi:hypothetical protein